MDAGTLLERVDDLRLPVRHERAPAHHQHDFLARRPRRPAPDEQGWRSEPGGLQQMAAGGDKAHGTDSDWTRSTLPRRHHARADSNRRPGRAARGSIQSRSASQSRLIASTVTVSARQGQSSSSGACAMVARAPRIINPHEASGGTTPSPRNDNPLSSTTAAPGRQRDLHQHRAKHVRQHGPQQDARRRSPHRARRLHIIAATHREHLRIGHAGKARQKQHRQHQDQRLRAGPHQRDHEQRQQHRRKAQQHVHRAHRDQRPPAAEPAADQPKRHPANTRERHRNERDRERDPPAPNQPREHIAPKLVAPKHAPRHAARQTMRHILLDRIRQPQHRRRQRNQKQRADRRPGDHQAPHALRTRGSSTP